MRIELMLTSYPRSPPKIRKGNVMREIIFISVSLVWWLLGLANAIKFIRKGDVEDILFGIAILMVASMGATLLIIYSSPDSKGNKKSTKE